MSVRMKAQRLAVYPGFEHGLYRYKATQGETGLPLVFELYENTGEMVDASGSVVLLYVEKPDRNVAVLACENNIAGEAANVVRCELTYQATACPGECSMYLQLLQGDSDIRFDNLSLLVTPADLDGIVSQSDFGPLTHLIQNAGAVSRMLSRSENASALLADVLSKYTEGASVEREGSLYSGTDTYFESDIQYDAAGNLLFIDKWNWGSLGTMLSTDGGSIWEKSPLQDESAQETVMVRQAVAGDKYLFLCNDYLLWGKIVSGKLVTEPPLENPLKISQYPMFINGRFLNGKYFVFRSIPFVYDGTEKTNPPAYFTGSGAGCVVINLPDNEMAASDIAYDADSGKYYMTGGYPKNSPRDYDKWLISSTNLVTWSVEAAWTDDSTINAFMTLRDGKINIYQSSSGSALKMWRFDMVAKTVQAVTLPQEKSVQVTGTDFTDYCDIVICTSGFFITKDGVAFQWIPVEEEIKNSDGFLSYSAHGRRIAISGGKNYAVYRLDLAGESIVDKNARLDTLLDQAAQALADAQGVAENSEEARKAAAAANKAAKRAEKVSDEADEKLRLLDGAEETVSRAEKAAEFAEETTTRAEELSEENQMLAEALEEKLAQAEETVKMAAENASAAQGAAKRANDAGAAAEEKLADLEDAQETVRAAEEITSEARGLMAGMEAALEKSKASTETSDRISRTAQAAAEDAQTQAAYAREQGDLVSTLVETIRGMEAGELAVTVSALLNAQPIWEEITIPAEGWRELDTVDEMAKEGCRVTLELEVPKASISRVPEVTIQKGYLRIAQDAMLSPRVESYNGILQFWAKASPSQPIPATLELKSKALNGSGDGTAVVGGVPIASKTTLGGIIIGDNLEVDENGRTSAVISEDALNKAMEETTVTDQEAEAAMSELFGPEN